MSNYLDSNGLRFLWTKIKNLFVQKENGKSLSTNDFTTAYKNKLDGIASGANNYSLPTATSTRLGGIKVGSGLSISNGVLSASGGDPIYGTFSPSYGGSQYKTVTVTLDRSVSLLIVMERDDNSFYDDYYSLSVIALPGNAIKMNSFNDRNFSFDGTTFTGSFRVQSNSSRRFAYIGI